MDKNLDKRKMQLASEYDERKKQYKRLDEQCGLFHKWIGETQMRIFNIRNSWRSEEANNFILEIEEEIIELKKKNLKLAEDHEEKWNQFQKEYEEKVEKIEMERKEEDNANT